MRSALRAVVASLVFLFAVSSADAKELTEEETSRSQDIIRTTMSPFCPGRTLEACPSPYAGEWRADIREWVSEGVSTQDIRGRLKKRMPNKDLTGTPSTMLDSVLPAIVSVFAVVVLIFLLRHLLKPSKDGDPSPRDQAKKSKPSSTKSDEALEQELDDELDELDG